MIYDAIDEAIKDSKVVYFDYYSELKGFSYRIGEPYQVIYIGSSNKLYLWDYDRSEIRAFIIDNISNFTISDETFIPRNILKH